ncbi:MAG TPA: NAD(P)-dependent oxidoreductase, partial [Xanthobacteraceae bacterium]
RLWRDHDQPAASKVAVGVMGLGVLGRDAANVLSRIGFKVAGWSRTEKTIPGIETFHGDGELDAFLARTEILVCLLPHTTRTEGILNRALFHKLNRSGALGGAVLINAGRGKLQIDADIIDALDKGILTAATLDVFATEPLPDASPLWVHPKLTITPHNAALSDARSMASNMLKQIERLERGLPLQNAADRSVGY